GDFNASADSILTSNSKFKLLQFLSYNNMSNLVSHTNLSQPTWYSSRYQSEIYFIWTHNPLLPYLLFFEIDDSNFSTSSDHKILISCWSLGEIWQVGIF